MTHYTLKDLNHEAALLRKSIRENFPPTGQGGVELTFRPWELELDNHPRIVVIAEVRSNSGYHETMASCVI